MNTQMSDPAKTVRILLVDDHEIMRAGLRMLVDKPPHQIVVGEASSVDEACATAQAEKPDIILLDIQLGPENSLSRIEELMGQSAGSSIIILTGVADTKIHRQAIANGAMGVVRKEQATTVLQKAIERVYEGEVWIDRLMMADVLFDKRRSADEDIEQDKIAALTARELEIIVLIGTGLKNKVIADQLFISEITVRNHLASIFRKLDVNDRLSLAIYSYRHSLVKPPS